MPSSLKTLDQHANIVAGEPEEYKAFVREQERKKREEKEKLNLSHHNKEHKKHEDLFKEEIGIKEEEKLNINLIEVSKEEENNNINNDLILEEAEKKVIEDIKEEIKPTVVTKPSSNLSRKRKT